MLIENIEIKGWRSFDCEGVKIQKIKRINLFIGPNNYGKSNIGRFFLHLKTSQIEAVNSSPYAKYLKFDSQMSYLHGWAWTRCDIEANIRVSSNQISEFKCYFSPAEHNIDLAFKFEQSTGNSSCQLLVDGNSLIDPKSEPENPKLLNFHNGYYEEIHSHSNGSKDTTHYWDTFLKSFVFVDAIRHHNRSSNLSHPFYFDGASTIKELTTLSTDESHRAQWMEYKKNLKGWISELLKENISNIEIIDGNLRIDVLRESNDINFTLGELGTGVSQLIMLLSHLYLNKNKHLNIFLEEPEANLHPEALCKFLNIIDVEFKNHSFFITTHSSAVIDQFKKGWNIYKISRKNNSATELKLCENLTDYYHLFDDLGIKASQILQSNLVIWVEGPSDRIYLKKWIDFHSNSKFKENIHYSFIYYGGSNLTSFTFSDASEEIDLIRIFNTSRYTVLVCDSDCHCEEEWNEGDFKKRVLDRLHELDNLREGNRDINKYNLVWITYGREIENYIPKACFENLSKTYKRKYIYRNKQKLSLTTDNIPKENKDFFRFDSFDNFLASRYTLEDASPLLESEISNISNYYNKEKVNISKTITSDYPYDCKIYPYDFKERMLELIAILNRANNTAFPYVGFD